MNDSLKNSIELNKKIINSIDKVLASGDWEATLYLRTAAKNLRKLRDEAATLLASIDSAEAEEIASTQIQTKPGYRCVFISLYQADGMNLHKWYASLKSLPEFSISRPVYTDEDHLKEMLRTKPEPAREAYISIYIKEDDLIQTGKQQTDRLGHPLLTLKAGAVHLTNVIEFVHKNKKYKLREGKLIPLNTENE